jgi:hypothetical protein
MRAIFAASEKTAKFVLAVAITFLPNVICLHSSRDSRLDQIGMRSQIELEGRNA